MAKPISIEVWNPSGKYRVVSTKSMPGTRWIRLLSPHQKRLPPRDLHGEEDHPLCSVDDIIALIGDHCDGVIGQIEGFKMNLIYYDLYQATRLEKFVTDKPASGVGQDHLPLINPERLAIMNKEAVLVNASRGPVIDEVALVEHLKANPMFRVGHDVFEDEPYMKPALAEMKNAVVVPCYTTSCLPKHR